MSVGRHICKLAGYGARNNLSKRIRMENIDSRIPSFGFYYCLLQRVDGSLADFCNTICQKQTHALQQSMPVLREDCLIFASS
jgi:hypothetical protein